MSRGERWILAVLALGIFGLFAAEIARDYDAKKLSALFIFLWWWPLLLIHELGHAVCARLFGFPVTGVVVGFGRVIWAGEVRGVYVELRVFPLEGFTSTYSPRGARLKNAAVYFAGPGVELAAAALALAVLGPARMFARSEAVGVIALQSLALAAVIGAGFNLIPHHGRAGGFGQGRPIASDGLGILKSLFG